MAGPTGLEPATSGVTDKSSRVSRHETIYPVWDNSLNQRRLRAENRKLATHLATRNLATRGDDSAAWNKREIRGTFFYCDCELSADVRACAARGCMLSIAEKVAHVRSVEDTNKCARLTFQRDGEAQNGEEVRQLDTALHLADVRVRHADEIGECLLRHPAFLAQHSQTFAEEFSGCCRTCRRCFHGLTNCVRELILKYQKSGVRFI